MLITLGVVRQMNEQGRDLRLFYKPILDMVHVNSPSISLGRINLQGPNLLQGRLWDLFNFDCLKHYIKSCTTKLNLLSREQCNS